MRRPIVAGNWKMNKTAPEAGELAQRLVALGGELCAGRDVVLCPPFTALEAVRQVLTGSPICLGAQNMHWEATGAYTGEVSAPMLLTSGCTHVILGHSERRQYFAETDETVNRKLHAALHTGLTPIVCVGESLQQREAGKLEATVVGQVEAAFKGIASGDASRVVLAYEPIWAIGTGRTATTQQAQEAHALIRRCLQGAYGREVASRIRIQYGGSVKAENAAELFACPDIDGGLIGGASLNAEGFAAIVRSAG
ncbi:MAG: triose-phosphate isomerase [Candidatus Latescibacterota bacterium]